MSRWSNIGNINRTPSVPGKSGRLGTACWRELRTKEVWISGTPGLRSGAVKYRGHLHNGWPATPSDCSGSPISTLLWPSVTSAGTRPTRFRVSTNALRVLLPLGAPATIRNGRGASTSARSSAICGAEYCWLNREPSLLDESHIVWETAGSGTSRSGAVFHPHGGTWAPLRMKPSPKLPPVQLSNLSMQLSVHSSFAVGSHPSK